MPSRLMDALGLDLAPHHSVVLAESKLRKTKSKQDGFPQRQCFNQLEEAMQRVAAQRLILAEVRSTKEPWQLFANTLQEAEELRLMKAAVAAHEQKGDSDLDSMLTKTSKESDDQVEVSGEESDDQKDAAGYPKKESHDQEDVADGQQNNFHDQKEAVLWAISADLKARLKNSVSDLDTDFSETSEQITEDSDDKEDEEEAICQKKDSDSYGQKPVAGQSWHPRTAAAGRTAGPSRKWRLRNQRL
eukprot:CAMPEP_0197625208 /NCGR_PEP_ID=MMETSP1338-20131121/4627_1 /TAXON_ID=43686 ORGANISM="Pelagodinium beii, Strain RCC1491" /NCGR_SAMPLE_ID=MMETSP1338 /ASSEMBLY_ACC=CAM_ASM_000754 /LENGTH=244 /DNA_ID=CAMNT_0043195551 /DNA_START=78 /DNA_END=812 /DNA_ORIENTATION=-